ncbi:MAG TPA: DUF417 family protein [Chitinophagaceae bacterium]|nr:DUF417 family protein [Chitinophagaceae bacterium]
MSNSFIRFIANLEPLGKKAVRFGMVVVLLWIGLLKFFAYEADGIVPFVANSPFMSFFYAHPQQYAMHTNKEGELNEGNRAWHRQNNTYAFSYGLGILLILIAVLLIIHPWAPAASMLGSMLAFLLTVGTLSFLITTPESWVPHAGDANWGFPFLSGRGRLVIKDIVILGGSILTMSESAALYLSRKENRRLVIR